MKLKVTEQDLINFEQDLWKDARKMELGVFGDIKTIRRFSDKQLSIKDEFQFIKNLKDRVAFKLPEILESADKYINFEYIAGTRAFNLLMDLRQLFGEANEKVYLKTASKLLSFLEEDLKEFQAVFNGQPQEKLPQSRYPARRKIGTLYEILCSILSIEGNADDLSIISEIYEKNAALPFRDASPKNIVLNIPELYQKHFNSYSERLNKVRELVKSGFLEEVMESDIIYHIDFTGCCYSCPELDDWIALRKHECSAWMSSDKGDNFDSLSNKDLCTWFVRYSRFGGRKLAYRLLNHSGHQVRFGMDNEVHYFMILKTICNLLADRKVIVSGTLSNLMTQLAAASKIIPEKDYFHHWKNITKTYYSDVFPN